MQESRFQRSQSRFVETSRASRPGLALRVEGREDGRVGRLAVDEHGVGRDGGDVVEGPLVEPVLDEVGVEEAMRVRLPDVEVARLVQEEVVGDVVRGVAVLGGDARAL